MEIKIQSIHFDATDKLEAFIEKKVAKLEKDPEGGGTVQAGEARHYTEQGGQHERGCSRHDAFRREDKRYF